MIGGLGDGILLQLPSFSFFVVKTTHNRRMITDLTICVSEYQVRGEMGKVWGFLISFQLQSSFLSNMADTCWERSHNATVWLIKGNNLQHKY